MTSVLWDKSDYTGRLGDLESTGKCLHAREVTQRWGTVITIEGLQC